MPLSSRFRAHESWSRSVVKAVTYRCFMILITITVAFVFTGDTAAALSIGIVTNLIKTGTYYGYERLWARISWGAVDRRQSRGGIVEGDAGD